MLLVSFMVFCFKTIFLKKFQWQQVNPEELADTKLKCVFELPGTGEQRFTGDKSSKCFFLIHIIDLFTQLIQYSL